MAEASSAVSAVLPESTLGVTVFPKISLVMPSFNQGQYIESAIRSVVEQDYPNLEMIVADGGSTDDSLAVIQRYASKLTKWRAGPDGGQAAALRWGFEQASGDIQCWLNSDDILFCGTLHKVAETFEKAPSAAVLYCDRAVIDATGVLVGHHVWPNRLRECDWYRQQPLAQEATFWRTSLYSAVGGINPNFDFVMDYDLFVRMWRHNPKGFRKGNFVAGALRVHDAAKNATLQDVWRREVTQVSDRERIAAPGWLQSRLLNRFRRGELRAALRRCEACRAQAERYLADLGGRDQR